LGAIFLINFIYAIKKTNKIIFKNTIHRIDYRTVYYSNCSNLFNWKYLWIFWKIFQMDRSSISDL